MECYTPFSYVFYFTTTTSSLSSAAAITTTINEASYLQIASVLYQEDVSLAGSFLLNK